MNVAYLLGLLIEDFRLIQGGVGGEMLNYLLSILGCSIYGNIGDYNMFEPKLPTSGTKSGNETYFSKESKERESATGTVHILCIPIDLIQLVHNTL